MLTCLRGEKLTRIQDYNLLTFKIYFKFETTTYSLTGVKSRDASASKKFSHFWTTMFFLTTQVLDRWGLHDHVWHRRLGRQYHQHLLPICKVIKDQQKDFECFFFLHNLVDACFFAGQ